jgi:hypothetical protein
MREQVSPTEINREMLMTAEQADPVAVAEFRKELAELEVAPEVIDMLNTMVDEVLANPNEYPAIRQKYLDMGVDEEILPEAFDAGLFAALNIALDELRGPENMLPPQSFARGGIASLNPMAREMAEAGRYGDTMLAHISPVEAQILRRYGGSGTINPMTGMPEFFLKKTFKKLGKAVKKFANTTIGKIVIGTALFMVAGPAAAAMLGASAGGAAAAGISGFVSGAGTSLLAGGNLKDSLKAGAIGGITAGVSKGVMNRMGTPAAAAAETAKLPDIGTAPAADTGVRTFGLGEQSPIQRARYLGSDMQMPSPLSQGIESVVPGASRSATGTPMMAGGFDPNQAATSRLPQASRVSAPTATTASVAPATSGGTLNIGRAAVQPQGQSGFRVGQQYPDLQSLPDSMRADVSTGADKNIFQRGLDRILPGRIEERGVADALKQTSAEFPGLSVEQIENAAPTSAVGRFYASKLPGPISKYAPLAATGLGIMALTGGFKEEEVAPPEGFEDFMLGSPGERYLEQNPDQRIRYGGAYTTSTTPQFNPYSYTPPPRAAAKGGSMDKEFPRKTGPINGPGTGTSDDIPAMLSDGEFVFTAKAVRNMGDGSRRKGAQRMYALMRKLEGRKNV